jgi:hypothetical protein
MCSRKLSESLSAAYEADRGRQEQARSANEKLKTKANRAKHIVDIVYRPIYLWGHEKYMTTYRGKQTLASHCITSYN